MSGHSTIQFTTVTDLPPHDHTQPRRSRGGGFGVAFFFDRLCNSIAIRQTENVRALDVTTDACQRLDLYHALWRNIPPLRHGRYADTQRPCQSAD